MGAKLEVCPRCGNQQKLEKTSFCTKCGLAIGDVKEMLVPELSESNKHKDKNLWEMLVPELGETDENKKLWTIVSQGLGLIIFGIVLALILELLQDFNIIPKVFVKIAFIGFLVAGILRMGILFLFGENILTGKKEASIENDGATKTLTNKNPTEKSLPEAEYRHLLDSETTKFDTNELATPASVTENTTKLLEKEFSEK